MQELAPKLQNRFQSLDFLRGIALLGILLMNVPGFAYPNAILSHFTDFTGINYRSWWIVNVFFEGTMRGLFSMLFGASCMLILSKTDDINSIDIYFKRLMWLFVFGLFNAFVLMWFGDILYGYALVGLFLFPFRKTAPKWLIIIGLSLSIFSFGRITYKYANEAKLDYLAYKSAMADSTKLHKKLTVKQKESIAKLDGMKAHFKKDTAKINKEI